MERLTLGRSTGGTTSGMSAPSASAPVVLLTDLLRLRTWRNDQQKRRLPALSSVMEWLA